MTELILASKLDSVNSILAINYSTTGTTDLTECAFLKLILFIATLST